MKLCAKNHPVHDIVNFCPVCGSAHFTRPTEEPGVATTPSSWFLSKFVAPRDGSSAAFRHRFPGVLVTLRALRFVGILWVVASFVVVGTSYQHWQHRHVRGVLETNWLLAEVAVAVVGAVAFAVAYGALQLLRDIWEQTSELSSGSLVRQAL